MPRETDWIPAYHDPILTHLLGTTKLSVEACAEEMRFSHSTILQQARRLKLLPPAMAHLPAEPPTPKIEKPNPLAVARFWLGRRLEERPAGYYVDSQPANLDAIMREANRLAVLNGAKPLLYKESWRP